LIHIERGPVKLPERFASTAERELQRLSVSVLKDRRPKFRAPTTVKGVREALFRLFHGKCAYCESPLDKPSAGQLDLFRPRQNARGHSASDKEEWFYRHHYWWLSWEWRNLYLSCKDCNRSKGTWFPVVGERVGEGTSWDSLGTEQCLFIDPCVDDPEEFLVYDEKGVVHPRLSSSKAGKWREERAETTIKLLGLNRSALVEARRERMGKLESSLWESWEAGGDLESPADEGLVGDAAPFAGACRFLERQLKEESRQKAAGASSRSFSIPGGATLGMPSPDPGPRTGPPELSPELAEQRAEPKDLEVLEGAPPEEAAPEAPMEAPAPVEAPSEAEARPDTSRVTAFLERITLSNFRAIESLSLEFSRAGQPKDPTALDAAAVDLADDDEAQETTPPKEGWWVLLGENGSGKSSVLQAVALGLAGQVRSQKILDEMGIQAKNLQRRVPRGAPAPGNLRVELELSGEPYRIVYRLQGNRLHFEQGSGGAQSVVRAYGTSRLPPRRFKHQPSPEEQKEAKKKLEELVTIESLFNPHETLIDPEAWLLGEDDQTFKRAALALADLFDLPQGAVYKTKRPREVKVRRGKDRAPLSQLSDGYQALTGLVAHLMAAIPKGVSDLHEESGIVLIDELGVHLHPRWRMNIVKGLRAAFPRFQFLATTHEPLCLRGLEDGEVGVMYHLPSGVSVIDKDVPSLKGLRVDQILTSSHFGLSTTIDPDLDRKFRESFDLLARKEKGLSPSESARLDALERELSPHRVLGYTRQDQLVYELIGAYLGQEQKKSAEGRKKLKAKTKKRVLEAWRRVGWSQGAEP